MKKIFSKFHPLRLLSSFLLAIPAIVLLNTNLPKYNGAIKTIVKNSNNNYVKDLNKDGIAEQIMFANINGDEQLYAEVWSDGLLLGVWNGSGKLIKSTIKWDDIDKDNKQEVLFITLQKDSIFLNQVQFVIENKKLIPTLELKTYILKGISKDEYTHSFKTELADINGDGLVEYIFNLNHGIPIRGLYLYDFVAKKFLKSNFDFTHITDFSIINNNLNNNKQILYTSYANCNVTSTNINKVISKFNLDTNIAHSYYSDCNSYIGLLDTQLKPISKPIAKEGFTSMYRAIPYQDGEEKKFLALESFINQKDSGQVLKIFNEKLTLLKQNKLFLPIDNKNYEKFNLDIFYKIQINNKDRFLFVGFGDSIYEINIKTLKAEYLMSLENIKEGCKIKEFDLDNDSINEIIFCCEKGLYIFKNDLTDGVFVASESGLDFSRPFEKTYSKEKVQGVRIIAGRNQLVIQYEYNKLYSFRVLFILLILSVIYLILYLSQVYQTKKLKQENKKLEQIVEERTLLVKQQNIDLELKNKEINIQKNIIYEKHKEFLDSINYAKRIQEAILPPMSFWKEQLPESFILYKPKDIVAGDFYWMENIQGKTTKVILFSVADCTGHGVPGALVSVVCNDALTSALKEYGSIDPGKLLTKARNIIIEKFEKAGNEINDGMDISLCALNTYTNELTWAGANNPLWIIRNNNLIELKPDKMPVGKYISLEPFTTQKIQLQKSDIIYLFSDGYADQFGGKDGKKFKYKQLKELLQSFALETMEEQKNILEKVFNEWKGNVEQIDDVCIIGVKI